MAVEGERGFQRDEGQAGANPFGEIFIEFAGGGFVNACGYFDSCAAELYEASACDGGIWILHCGDHSFDSCGDDCVCAGAGAACGAAGFEGDIESCATGLFASFFQGDDFGVVEAVVVVEAFADDAAIFDDDAADARIGVREGCAACARARARAMCDSSASTLGLIAPKVKRAGETPALRKGIEALWRCEVYADFASRRGS